MEQHSSSASKQSEADRFTILLVEDNFLNRRMVKKALEKNYIIKEAADAETAAEMLRLGKVHLAIIDLHLGNGKNDGIWLGEQVKQKHDIPFIYLTAFGNGDISQRAISTYPSSYITKPFKEIDLALSIEIALLKYIAVKPVKNNWMLVKDGDYFVKEWLENFEQYIQKNISNLSLSVLSLSLEFAMSESTLLRQLKRLTGLTPLQYMQEIRLNEARQMLENRTYKSVSQVAAKVGYSDARSFSRAFKTRFGKLPTEMV